MINNTDLNLILASNSQARKSLLLNADISFKAIPANIDEDIIKQKNIKLNISPEQTAQDLADAKALFVSKANQLGLILGSDQICHIDNQILNKPKTTQKLFERIKKLNGKTHTLTSAFTIVKNNKVIYQYKDDAHLTLYNMSDADINDYINRASDAVLNSAGGYHLEAVGIQLFKKIEGSYFTILGLPLLPLIEFLKTQNNRQ